MVTLEKIKYNKMKIITYCICLVYFFSCFENKYNIKVGIAKNDLNLDTFVQPCNYTERVSSKKIQPCEWQLDSLNKNLNFIFENISIYDYNRHNNYHNNDLSIKLTKKYQNLKVRGSELFLNNNLIGKLKINTPSYVSNLDTLSGNYCVFYLKNSNKIILKGKIIKKQSRNIIVKISFANKDSKEKKDDFIYGSSEYE